MHASIEAQPHDDSPPRVVVSMPARNAAPFLGEAIESVLRQEGVNVRLFVVDDASTDATGAVASRYSDQGVRVIRNDERRGIGYCHNVVIQRTDEPLVAHVDADDVILPGALAKMAHAVLRDDRAGQAYCDFYPIDATGSTSPSRVADSKAFFARHRAHPVDYARELVVHGMVVSALRTYRRTAFDVVGHFDEELPWAVDYEMALRLAEHFRFVHVPELLYCRRVHEEGVTQRLRSRRWRYWWMRWQLVRRRLRAQGGSLFGQGAGITHARLLLGLLHTARAEIIPSARGL